MEGRESHAASRACSSACNALIVAISHPLSSLAHSLPLQVSGGTLSFVAWAHMVKRAILCLVLRTSGHHPLPYLCLPPGTTFFHFTFLSRVFIASLIPYLFPLSLGNLSCYGDVSVRRQHPLHTMRAFSMVEMGM